MEMVISMGVLAVIMTGLLMMFQQTQKALRRSNVQVDVMETGRAVMDMLTRELQESSACQLSDGVNFYATEITNAQPLAQPLPAGGGTRQNDLEELFFLTRLNQDWYGHGYYVANTNYGIGMGIGFGTLYRFLTKDTAAKADTLFNIYTNACNYIKDMDYFNQNFHRMADGIVHLEIRVCDAEGRRPPDGTNAANTVEIGPNKAVFKSNALPYFVEVELGVLEPQVLEQIKAQPANRARKFLEERVHQVHVFHQRIPLRNAAAQ